MIKIGLWILLLVSGAAIFACVDDPPSEAAVLRAREKEEALLRASKTRLTPQEHKTLLRLAESIYRRERNLDFATGLIGQHQFKIRGRPRADGGLEIDSIELWVGWETHGQVLKKSEYALAVLHPDGSITSPMRRLWEKELQERLKEELEFWLDYAARDRT